MDQEQYEQDALRLRTRQLSLMDLGIGISMILIGMLSISFILN